MTAKTRSIGLVKALSGNRIDIFTSEGKIENGVYMPLKFLRFTSKNDENRTREYLFNYENKTVIKNQTIQKIETKSSFNPIEVSFSSSQELITEKTSENIDFQRNDFLSLYLNLMHGKLTYGKVPYVDMKKDDKLLFIEKNLFEIHKNHGEDTYHVKMIPDSKSIFFDTVTSVGIAFYGDAYIKKITESSRTKE